MLKRHVTHQGAVPPYSEEYGKGEQEPQQVMVMRGLFQELEEKFGGLCFTQATLQRVMKELAPDINVPKANIPSWSEITAKRLRYMMRHIGKATNKPRPPPGWPN